MIDFLKKNTFSEEDVQDRVRSLTKEALKFLREEVTGWISKDLEKIINEWVTHHYDYKGRSFKYIILIFLKINIYIFSQQKS